MRRWGKSKPLLISAERTRSRLSRWRVAHADNGEGRQAGQGGFHAHFVSINAHQGAAVEQGVGHVLPVIETGRSVEAGRQ